MTLTTYAVRPKKKWRRVKGKILPVRTVDDWVTVDENGNMVSYLCCNAVVEVSPRQW